MYSLTVMFLVMGMTAPFIAEVPHTFMFDTEKECIQQRYHFIHNSAAWHILQMGECKEVKAKK